MSVRHHPEAAAPVQGQGGGGAQCTRLAIYRNPYMHKSCPRIPTRASCKRYTRCTAKSHTKKVTATWRGGDLSAGDNTCPTKAATMRAGQQMITTAIYEHIIKTRAVHHASANVYVGCMPLGCLPLLSRRMLRVRVLLPSAPRAPLPSAPIEGLALHEWER